jgi:hypothetical protein
VYVIARFGLWILVVAFLFGVSALGHATEFGQSHADLGYIDTLSGMVPAPGMTLRDDLNVQVSGQLNDGRGQKLAIRLGALGAVSPKFRETVEADILAVGYVPNWQVPYINGTVGMAAYATVANARVGLTTQLGIPQSAASEKAGLGDITFVPAFLALHVPGTGVQVALSPFEFTAPTGRYAKDDPVGNNIGLNYWSYRPAVAVTYLSGAGQEASINLGASINAQNQATHYRSGTETYFTWAMAQHLPSGFSFGLGGYYYKQVGDDRVSGQVVAATAATDTLGAGPGNRGETFAIGPLLSYRFSQALGVQVHWDHEVFAYNRSQRDVFYARATLKF